MLTAGTKGCEAVIAEELDWWCGVHGCQECSDAYADHRVPDPHPSVKVHGPCGERLCGWSGLFTCDEVRLGEIVGPCPHCGTRIYVSTEDDPW